MTGSGSGGGTPPSGPIRLELDLCGALGGRLHPSVVAVEQDRSGVVSPWRDGDGPAPTSPRDTGDCVERPGRSDPRVHDLVIHDLDHRPSVRPGAVRRSLARLLSAVGGDGRTVVALEPPRLLLRSEGVRAWAEAVDAAVTETAAAGSGGMRIVVLWHRIDEVELASATIRAALLRRAARRLRVAGSEAMTVEARIGSARLQYRFVPGAVSGYEVSRVEARSGGAGRPAAPGGPPSSRR